ncbi:MAG: dienelactone hydrolase [Candidatus Azotimanducaceae bacterium]|jgi:dienelactone hydrolase
MHSATFEYQDGETHLEAYITYDDSITGPRPCVLVSHDWTGRREFATSKADEMAKLGYVGIAIDMYGKGVFGKDDDAELNISLMSPFATDRKYLRKRIEAGLLAAKKLEVVDVSKIAAIGYCFGGMCVLELARAGSDVLGVISIHGIFAAGDIENENMTAKVLCLHGHDDPMVPPEQVLALETEMSLAGVDWQVHAYGDTVHAFTNPKANDKASGAQFNPVVNKRATESIKQFLAEVFV